KPVDLGPDDVTIGEEMKRAGYATAVIGKWGMAEHDDAGMPSKQGFDYFYGYRKHSEAHHYYPQHLWRNDEKVPLEGNNIQQKQGQYAHDLLTDQAVQWVQDNQDKPFLLYLAYTVPHYELTVPDD